MKVIEVQFTPLNKTYWFDPENHNLAIGDSVIVKTEVGTKLGQVISFKDINLNQHDKEIKPIIRKANFSDLEKISGKNKHREQDLKSCRDLIEKHNLNMKITDIHYSFDGGRLTFYFTASGRVDFRELVKDLTHHFQKSIRLHQIGVRDEARSLGQIGPCGKCICCKTFLDKLDQVNSDCAEIQNISHRGSDKLTGICGRLKCCLRFEQDMYEQLCQQLPPLGTPIKTEQGRGEVISHNPLKQSVNVRLHEDTKTIIEHPIN